MGFKVGQKYRTNILSFQEGGHIVIVQRRDGRRFEYDNIKYPVAYIAKLKRNPNIKDAWIKEQSSSDSQKREV